MPRQRTWRDELSVDRLNPDQIQMQDLRQQRLEQQVAADPLTQQLRELQAVHAQSVEAKARYELNKEIQTDRQRTAFYNGLQELESFLANRGATIGTREHAEAFAAYAHEFPLARSSADVQKTLELHAKIADDQAALEQRMRELNPPPENIAQRHANVIGNVEKYQELMKADLAEPIDIGHTAEIKGNLKAFRKEQAQLERDYPSLLKPITTQARTPETSTATTTTTVPTATTAATPTATPIEKVMIQKEGKKFRLPKTQIQDALDQGYELVK